MTDLDKRLRWGILGTSFISHTVVKSIIASPDSVIKAIFGRNAERLDAFATKYDIPTRYDSIEALLDDPEVDVVYIGLPSHLHAEAGIAAAKKGKHILSEKSLTTTLQDAKDLIAVVKEAGVFFVEGLMYLSHPVIKKLSDVISQGIIGEVRGVSGYYAADIWKKANPKGMGTIYNLGCYPVSLLHYVLQVAYGEKVWIDRRVQGLGNLAPDGSHIRDASLVAKFDVKKVDPDSGEVQPLQGVMATIQSSDSFGNDFDFTVQGSKGSVHFKTNPWLPTMEDNIMEVKTYGLAGFFDQVVTQGDYDAFGCQIKMVEKCIAEGLKEAPRPSPRWSDSLEIMEVLTEWESAVNQSEKK